MPQVRPNFSSGGSLRGKRNGRDSIIVQQVAKPKKKNFWLLRRCLFILCFVGFVANSYKNMKKYWTGGNTVTESWVFPESKKLQLPALTICPAAGIYGYFLSKDYGKTELKDLLNCKLSEGKDCLQCMKEARGNQKLRKVNFSVHQTIYTAYRGKCYTVTPPYETSPLSFLQLSLGSEPSLIYLHEPDEQFFIHLAWYPGEAHPVFEAGSNILFKLATITRSKFEGNENCKKWSTQEQIECIKHNIRSDYERSELNCTVPWFNSMLDPIPPTDEMCRTEQESERLHNIIHDSMALHMSTTCPASCSQVQYHLSVESFGASSPNSSAEIFLRYSTTATRLVQSVPLSTLSDFISNVGGNLGLFLDFSIISLLIALLNRIQ